MTVQHFTLEVENLFNKPKTFTPVFLMIASNEKVFGPPQGNPGSATVLFLFQQYGTAKKY